MLYSKIIRAVAFAGAAYAEAIPEPANTANSNAADSTTLLSNLVQKGSTASGAGAIGSESGQALSATSNSNFINFCSGKAALTNGLQVTTGSCNGIRKYA